MIKVKLPEDLEKVITFHGHLCPGIVIGYRASKAALDILSVRRSEDEELIAIVENDSCAVDAVQFLTGCTFGKGNLFLLDYGKQVFTFAVRPSGRAVRLSLKPLEIMGFDEDSDLIRLDRKIRENTITPEEGSQRRELWIEALLNEPADTLFRITTPHIELPEEARSYQSIICENCGEPVMETRTRYISGKTVCIPCADMMKVS